MWGPFRSGRLLLELRRRHVFRVAFVYGAIAWLVIQIAATSFPYLDLPRWTVTLIIVLAMLGLPIALVLAWAYDLTPDGVRRAEPLEPANSADAATAAAGTAPAVAASRAAAPPLARRGLAVAAVGVSLLLGGYLYTIRPAAATAEADALHSIAVLPFVNMSADQANEYFSDGLTEELLNLLAQVEGLRVAARTSAFAFKGVNDDVTEIGRKLNVQTVLEGSVRRTADRLRVTAQLINVADGYHIWSRTFDHRDIADIFVIQDEISRAIVANLLPRFAIAELAAHGSTTDVHAYDEYLKGRYAFWQGTAESNLRTAIAHYEAALERDPGYALAYAGLSDAFMLLGGQHAEPNDVFPQAKAAALRALELDDQLAEGYVALASINWFYEWDWLAAERNYRRSFSVNRAVYTRCICYVWYLAVLGDIEAAVREGQRARSLDPVGHLPLTTLAQMYFLAGRRDEARATLADLEQAGSTSPLIARLRAWMAWDEGRRDAAVAQLETLRASFDGRGGFAASAPPIAVAELAFMLANTGRRAEARQLAEQLEGRAQQRYVPAELVAAAFASVGESAEAERWIERAYRSRSNLGMFSAYPIARALEPVPAYADVLRRVGVPARARAAVRAED
jgi:adenylate cyclase